MNKQRRGLYRYKMLQDGLKSQDRQTTPLVKRKKEDQLSTTSP